MNAQTDLKYGNIVINEILYRPDSVSAEFIELYNNLENAVSLKQLSIVIGKDTIQSIDGSIDSKSYLVMTSDKKAITTSYLAADEEKIIEVKLPRLTDSGKWIGVLSDSQAKSILMDSFYYRPSNHSEILDNNRGVSLERIDPSIPAYSYNWHSCTDEKYYATPTLLNSVFGRIDRLYTSISFDYSRVISPNGDGHQDNFYVKADVDDYDYLVSVRVVTVAGEEIFRVADRVELLLLPSQSWTEIQNLTSGHYFLLLEVFNDSGFRRLFQLPFAILR